MLSVLIDKFPKQLKLYPLAFITAFSALILFACSSFKHAVFKSTAFDLGWFDQATYLISQGQPPIVSFSGFHILGDHAAWIFYPLSLLYKIYPDVHWIFAVQAIALSSGTLPIWHLARQSGLKESQSIVMAVVYLLYPLLFNINLFDFHPEVIALPALLAAILAAKLGKTIWFCLSIILILGCKAVLSLTVAAMGFWLLLFEKKRLCGAIALFAGIAWFIIATKLIIPFFSGHEAAAVGRYAFLGNSVFEIAQNLLLKPGIVLEKVFTLPNLKYICMLLLPVIWGISPKHLTPLIGAIPTLLLNILTDYQFQKDLFYQYSLPALPFLLLAVISTLSAGRGWLRNQGRIILWSLVTFLALAKFGAFSYTYLESLDTLQATREAISKIDTKGGVLTSAEIAPHVTHRPVVKLAIHGSDFKLTEFEYVLLNMRHPSVASDSQLIGSLVEKLKNTKEFELTYQRDDVYLFTTKP